MKRTLVVATAALAVALPAAPSAGAPQVASSSTSTPVRILIVGDSVTQGKVGEHTWRYHLWNTLRAAGKDIDFVGVHTGLYDDGGTPWDVDDDNYEAPGYADPDFDQDHAAWWGMSQTHIDKHLDVADLVASTVPDIVINDLGINDLAYDVPPSHLLDLMSDFVADVRAVRPHATVILGQLTQTWVTNGSGDPVVVEYNARLDDLAADLDQPLARVIAAPAPADYVQGTDTYDPAHPTASGEVKIADQFAGVVAALPPPYVPPPDVPAQPVPPAQPAPVASYSGAARVAAVLVGPKRRAVRLAFTIPGGATKQAIWKRDVTAGGPWRLVAQVGPGVHRYRVAGLVKRHRYAFRLRAYAGPLASTVWSNQARVKVS